MAARRLASATSAGVECTRPLRTVSASSAACTALLLVGAPLQLIALFLDLRDAANAHVVELAVGFLAMAALFQVADGVQAVTSGALRGLKDTRVPMVFAGLGYWVVGLPVGAVLAFGAGLRGIGIWIGLALGLGVVAVMMVVRWHARERLGLVGGPRRA